MYIPAYKVKKRGFQRGFLQILQNWLLVWMDIQKARNKKKKKNECNELYSRKILIATSVFWAMPLYVVWCEINFYGVHILLWYAKKRKLGSFLKYCSIHDLVNILSVLVDIQNLLEVKSSVTSYNVSRITSAWAHWA